MLVGGFGCILGIFVNLPLKIEICSKFATRCTNFHQTRFDYLKNAPISFKKHILYDFMYVHCENRVPDGFLTYFHHRDPRIDGLGPEHGPPF